MVLWKRLLIDGAVKAPTGLQVLWKRLQAYRCCKSAPETGAEKAPEADDAAQEPGTLDYGHVAGKGSWWQALSLWGRGRIFQWNANSIFLRNYVITIIPEDWTGLDPMYLAVDLSVSGACSAPERMTVWLLWWCHLEKIW